ncbi:hypothetical protein JB92DRAFT_2563402, partial [Gautieria morchelliformis]
VRCTINAQHNCAGNKCTLSATHPIRQEREDTTSTAPAVHHINPAQMVINLTQMRDASLLRPWVP